jgi:hypothetical protein
MKHNIELRSGDRKSKGSHPFPPGPMAPPAAFAVLSQHVLGTLPRSLGRRENLLRALVCCAPKPARQARHPGSKPVSQGGRR